jgi:hypothetical protein
MEEPRTRQITTPGGKAPFLSLVFAKGEGGATERNFVFYALRYNDRWTAEFNLRQIGRLPSLYKVQVSRRVGPGERLSATEKDPCETFLEVLLATLEQRISGRPETTSR